MTERRYTPEYWKIRAEEARMIAESFSNENTKRLLLDIAKNFDALATLAVNDNPSLRKIIGHWDNYARSRAIDVLLSTPFTHTKRR
jgi:hypothetical protein